jgi:hypothetical protein
MKHLHCLINALPSPTSFLENSHLASIRMRAIPAIKAAKALNWRVTYGEDIQGSPNILLIGKIGADNIEIRQSLWLKKILHARRTGRILLDYTDHHLGFISPMSVFYREAIKEVDGCIVPSKAMAGLLAQHWPGEINTIEDPIEIQPLFPKTQFNMPVTLLWFGHSSNVEFLIDFLATGFSIGDRIRLIVLSNEAGINLFLGSNLVSLANIEFSVGLWSLDSMLSASKVADICIIPSDVNNPRKMAVSSNRLISALALGLPVAADNLTSYTDFSDYYCHLRSFQFREMLVNPQAFSIKTKQAQINVVPHFLMQKIEQDWRRLFMKAG